MRLAGKRKRKEFLAKAKEWFKAHTETTLFFGDVESVAIRAVAEYMANQEELTLYDKRTC